MHLLDFYQNMNNFNKLFNLQSFGLNNIIWFLTMSDVFTWGLYMVITSFIGIYLSTKFGENALEIVGIGVACFNFAKGFFQIPIGYITDKLKTNKDDIIFLSIGNILMGLPYVFLPFISHPNFYYVGMFSVGLGGAMNLVNWRKLFAKHLQKGHEGMSYASYDTIMSISMILFGLVIGFVSSLSEHIFDIAISVIGILIICSSFWVLMIFFAKKKNGTL